MNRLFIAYFVLAVVVFVAGCSRETVTPSVGTINELESSTPSTTSVESTAPASPANEAMEGFALIAPLRSSETYLINNDKEVVHSWKADLPPAGTAYLMENGDLLRGARDPDFTEFRGGGIGYKLERYSWEGDLVWSFQYANEDHCFHHDIAPMPNGNILMIAWERISKEEAIAQGRDPKLLKDDLWPDKVVEIQPEGADGGTIVWEWRMWDHLIQDFDREKPNYGVIYEHPELIDLNNTGSTPPSTPEELRKLRAVGYTGGGDDDDDDRRRGSADWMHTNAINYNAELDQIALSAKHFSEVWIIDHSTTTEEAASHRGGKRGMGGDLLYRWGNPWSYKSGTVENKKLFDQHDVRWIPTGFPGAGNITAFNNGHGREYSSIIEIQPPMDEDGDYILDDEGRYGPNDLTWEYTAENKKDFYSSFISGSTRLANGNTYICEGATGRFFEVNSEGKKLWELFNPYGGELSMEGRPHSVEDEARKIFESGEGTKSFVNNTALFRATKYGVDYPGLAGRTLTALAEQPVPFNTLVEAAVEKLKAETPAEESQAAEAEAENSKTESQETESADSDTESEDWETASPEADREEAPVQQRS